MNRPLFLCFSCFAFILVSGNCDAQAHSIDSLEAALKISKEDSGRVNTLNSLALSFAKKEPDKANDYAEQSLQLAQSLDYKKGISNALHTIGSLKYYSGDYDAAIEYLFKDIVVCRQIADSNGVGTTYNSIGNIYAQQGDYDKALEYYLKSLALKELSGNKKEIASSYGNIGNINYLKNDFVKALEYYLKDLEIFEEIKDREGMANSYNNIGLIYANQGNAVKALEYYNKDLALTQEMGDKQAIADSYGNIGIVYAQEGDVQQALEYYEKSLALRKEVGDKVGISDSYNNIGSLYLKVNRLADAKEQLLLALSIATEINAKPGMMAAYLNLSKCDSASGNFKSAYEYHKLYSQFKDSVFNEESNGQLQELQAKYDSEKNIKKIALLNKEKEAAAALSDEENKRHLIILISVGGGLVGALLFAFYIFRGYRQKQKANLILADKNKIIEEKNKDITDSLNYAKRIQTAILVPREEISKTLKEFFILFKPKAIVSGDFYYYAKTNDKIIFAAVDCTGHGVPGAFMSMIGNDALNEIVVGKKIATPSEILEKLHDSIRIALKQENLKSDSNDGMDVALCALDLKNNSLEFAGALRNLYILRKENGSLEEITGDKKSLGGEMSNVKKTFANQTTRLNPGDTFYIFSDGYADQFGGLNGKKFMMTQFKKLLTEIQNKTMEEQERELDRTIENWKNNSEQIDDILVIGVRV